MSKLMNMTVAGAAAALLMSGSALAAGLPVASGEAPVFNPAATSTQLSRSAVESLAAQAYPASGENSASGSSTSAADALTRAEVHAAALSAIHAGEIATGEDA